MQYDQQKWSELRGQLSRIVDNEVHVFNADELDHIEHILNVGSPSAVGRQLEVLLANSPLSGELLLIFTKKFEGLVGTSIRTGYAHETERPIHMLSRWVTSPSTKGAGIRI